MNLFNRLRTRNQQWLAKDHVFLLQLSNRVMSAGHANEFLTNLKKEADRVGIKGIYVYGDDLKVIDLGISALNKGQS